MAAPSSGAPSQTGGFRLMFSQIREGRHILLADLICVPEPSSSMPLTEKLLASFRRKDTPLIMIRPADIKVFLEMFQSESDTLDRVLDPAFPAFAQTWKWQFHDGISCAAPAGEETAPVRFIHPGSDPVALRRRVSLPADSVRGNLRFPAADRADGTGRSISRLPG